MQSNMLWFPVDLGKLRDRQIPIYNATTYLSKWKEVKYWKIGARPALLIIAVILTRGVCWCAPLQPPCNFFCSVFLKQTSVFAPGGSVLPVVQVITGVPSRLSPPVCQHLKQLCWCASEWGCLDSFTAWRGEKYYLKQPFFFISKLFVDFLEVGYSIGWFLP